MSRNHMKMAGLPNPEWDVATYAASEAGRLAGIEATRVRRWLQGYQYEYASPGKQPSVRRQRPLIRRQTTAGTTYASFLDLVDLLFVREFLKHGLSLQKVRKALDEASRILGTNHFARETFFTNGHNIYLQVKDSGSPILELLHGRQWVIAQFIRQLAHRIEFDRPSGFARRWYPLGRDGRIVVDPQISFGRPSIVESGVTTANVYDFFVAERNDIGRVCSWFGLDRSGVEAAVEFEQQMAA